MQGLSAPWQSRGVRLFGVNNTKYSKETLKSSHLSLFQSGNMKFTLYGPFKHKTQFLQGCHVLADKIDLIKIEEFAPQWFPGEFSTLSQTQFLYSPPSFLFIRRYQPNGELFSEIMPFKFGLLKDAPFGAPNFPGYSK